MCWFLTNQLYTDVSSAFFPGSTDMVREWAKLGFVEKVCSEPPGLPFWVEVERILHRDNWAASTSR